MKGTPQQVNKKLFDSIIEISSWPMFRDHRFTFVRGEYKSMVRLSVHVDASHNPVFVFSTQYGERWSKPALMVQQQSFGAKELAQFVAQIQIMQTGLLNAVRVWEREQS